MSFDAVVGTDLRWRTTHALSSPEVSKTSVKDQIHDLGLWINDLQLLSTLPGVVGMRYLFNLVFRQ